MKYRIAAAKSLLFSPGNWIKFREETSKVLQLEDSFVWCCNWDISGNRSEIPGKF